MADRPAGRTHPYIPNAAPAVKAEMLAAIGAASVDELYADIPSSLRLDRPLDLPPPFPSEVELVRHVHGLLTRNTPATDVLSFLGAGCYDVHVPAVCDEIASRAEFLTAYAGEPYEDHGRFQALFEYASLMGELLEMDVVNVPTYDGHQAAATALRMAARITGRTEVILPTSMAADRLSRIRDYLAPDIRIRRVAFRPATGELGADEIQAALDAQTAAVLVEVPNHFGIVESEAPAIVARAHARGALAVAVVEPSTLGVVAPPAAYDADIACGDIQALGMHMAYGGGHGGFVATADEPRLVMEYPSRLFGIAPTSVPGEYGFGDVAYERTSFAQRERGKEWVGTASALYGITAGVYLALMGPQGMRELGDGLMTRTRYAIDRLARIPGVRVPFRDRAHVREFVLDVALSGRTVAETNARLRERGIFGGADLSRSFPELGEPMLVSVSERHTRSDLDRFAAELERALA